MHETLVVIGLVLQGLTLVVLTFFLFHLLRAQGRLLLRLESLEQGKETSIDDPAIVPAARGLALRTAVPDFELPDLNGNTISLSSFRGKHILLLYWSPDCGFCDMLAPELVQMQSALEKRTQVVLVSYGDAVINRKLAVEHGLTYPILLLENSMAQKTIESDIFPDCGTPSAYLVDEQGRVARPLAGGMASVVRLAREALETKPRAVRKLPLNHSQIERDGLKAGTVAPLFSLPDIHGETVSLDRFRGRNVLLVFSDPQCGPCNDLAPELGRLHRKYANEGLAIVMVGRGDPEQNKQKAVQNKIRFPVVIQDRWKLSRQYGIFATPVAFLIDQDGVIMRNVAKGATEIMALAHEGLASNKESRYVSTV